MSKKEKCPKCNEPMEYKAVYCFGDSSLGVEDDWLQCPKCNHKKTI